MNSLILDLQNELQSRDCDVLSALRRAHVIADKLNLHEFDVWIKSELNGYSCPSQDDIPDYRKVHGELLARDPIQGWVPVTFPNSKMESLFCDRKLNLPLSEIIALYVKPNGNFAMNFNANVARAIDKMCSSPFPAIYTLKINNCFLQTIIQQVIDHLLEWTIKLGHEGIKGVGMEFSIQEVKNAEKIPQNINYYGPVFNGNVSHSPIITGNNNSISFNYEQASDLLAKVKTQLTREQLSQADRDDANELVAETERKIAAKKSAKIIKASLKALGTFLLGAGANVTGSLISQYLAKGIF